MAVPALGAASAPRDRDFIRAPDRPITPGTQEVPMTRRLLSALLAAIVAAGCAGPNKLAEKSQRELSEGDVWKAWQLATRALDREPMNPRARAAAQSTYQVISNDWQRRI